jgi:N-acetylglucosamine-6-sulfatase
VADEDDFISDLLRNGFLGAWFNSRVQMRIAAQIWILLLWVGAVLAPGAASQSRPNFLLFLTDDQRADTLSCAGNSQVQTPAFDRLAREGVRFERAFVVCSRCCPARASLLTGLFPHQHGVHSNDAVEGLLDRHATFAALLQAAGYRTAFLGKWHIDDNQQWPRPGFDDWTGFRGSSVDARQGEYWDPPLLVNGKPEDGKGFNTEVLTRRAVQWIEQQDDQPFLLIVSLKNCHRPMQPPEPYASAVDPAELRPPPDSWQDLPQAIQRKVEDGLYARFFPETDLAFGRRLAGYLGLVLNADACLQQLIAALEKGGHLGQTAVIATSDGGYLWGEHGLFGKGPAFEPSIRVPLLLRFPTEIPAGLRISQLALDVDLFCTLLDLAGVAVPESRPGRSLRPLWSATEQVDWRHDFLYYEPFRGGLMAGPPALALCGERWKYIRYRETQIEEALYNLHLDPGERHNLVDDPEHAGVLGEQRSRLQERLNEVEAPPGWWEPYQTLVPADRADWKQYADAIVTVLRRELPPTAGEQAPSQPMLEEIGRGLLLKAGADLRARFPGKRWTMKSAAEVQRQVDLRISWHSVTGKRVPQQVKKAIIEEWQDAAEDALPVLYVVFDPEGFIRNEPAFPRNLPRREQAILRIIR